MTGGSPAEGCTAIWRIGTRMSGWITPATCRFDEAGKGPVVTAGSAVAVVWSIWFIKATFALMTRGKGEEAGVAPHGTCPQNDGIGDRLCFLRQYQLGQVQRVASPQSFPCYQPLSPLGGTPLTMTLVYGPEVQTSTAGSALALAACGAMRPSFSGRGAIPHRR